MPFGVFRCISMDFGVFQCISVFTLTRVSRYVVNKTLTLVWKTEQAREMDHCSRISSCAT